MQYYWEGVCVKERVCVWCLLVWVDDCLAVHTNSHCQIGSVQDKGTRRVRFVGCSFFALFYVLHLLIRWMVCNWSLLRMRKSTFSTLLQGSVSVLHTYIHTHRHTCIHPLKGRLSYVVSFSFVQDTINARRSTGVGSGHLREMLHGLLNG